MDQNAVTLLNPWNSFYVITGSAAAALTGLQFVVIAVSANANMGSEGTTRAYGTPTIVHFSAVLLVSAVLSAPWHSLESLVWTLGGVALAGVGYSLDVLRHARKQHDYTPVLEDWICHHVLPLLAYGALVVAAVAMLAHPGLSLFVAGASSLLLLFVGIHNAWDAVTYITLRRRVAARGEANEK